MNNMNQELVEEILSAEYQQWTVVGYAHKVGYFTCPALPQGTTLVATRDEAGIWAIPGIACSGDSTLRYRVERGSLVQLKPYHPIMDPTCPPGHFEW